MVRDSTSIGLEGSWRFVVPTRVFGLGYAAALLWLRDRALADVGDRGA
jgi:hypothetical protein